MLLIYILPFVALVYLINSFLYNKIMDNILYLTIIIFMSVFAILYMQTTKFIDLSALTLTYSPQLKQGDSGIKQSLPTM